MNFGTRHLVGFAASLIFAAITVDAQTPAQMPPSVRVSAEATVHAMPDQAEVDLGVVTRAAASKQAASQNAARLDAVLARLRALLGPAARVRSIAYSVRPDYRDSRGDGTPTITGYTATNILRVTLADLATLSDVIDTALDAGANRVEGVRFSLQQEDAVRSQALREAAATARAEAETLASALGVRIVRVLAAAEDTAPVRPFAAMSLTGRNRGEAAATPIEVGPIEVSATVTVTVEVTAEPATAARNE